MFRVMVAVFLLGSVPIAQAAECGSTANRAGCVGPNGAIGAGPNGAGSYNRNTGAVHSTGRYNEVAPGTRAEGWRGNTATKGVEPGCGWVNGRRVCN